MPPALARSVHDLLRNAAVCYGADPAMIFLTGAEPSDRTLTYDFCEVLARSLQAANLFAKHGIAPGDVVTLLMPNLPETLWCMWGAEMAGVANPVNHYLEPMQLSAIIARAGAKALVVPDGVAHPDIEAKLRVILQEAPTLKVFRVGGKARADEISFDEAATEPSDRLVGDRKIAPEETAALFHTGGTTGTPKLARHSHGGLAAMALTNLAPLSREREVLLSGLPYFHVGGALLAGLAAIANGWTIVIPTAAGVRNPAVVANFWRILAQHRVSVGSGVPTSLTAALDVPRSDHDLSRLKLMVTGGSAAPVPLIAALEEQLGVPVIEGYGMTELHCFVCLPPAATEARRGSVGKPVAGMELRVAILSETGEIMPCSVNTVGHLLFRGAQVFPGYLDPADDDGVLLTDGWLNTGDLGRVDQEGFVWITGRAKDLIIRGGHNIDPLVIEEVLCRHPSVEVAAAVGRPDRYAGELPMAFVKLRPGFSAGEEELVAFARSGMSERAAAPVAVKIVDAVPLTAVGKISKAELRLEAAHQAFDAALQPLRLKGLDPQVTIERGTGGRLVAQITLQAADSALPLEAIAWCKKNLGLFQIPHEVRGFDHEN